MRDASPPSTPCRPALRRAGRSLARPGRLALGLALSLASALPAGAALAASDDPAGATEVRPPIFPIDLDAQGGPLDVPGELAVDLRDDVSSADVTALAALVGASLDDNSPDLHDDGQVFVAHVDPAREGEVLARLAADPRVESAERNVVARALFAPNDPGFKEQWHLSRVHAERAWDYACGAGVTVAVVDTGIACFDQAPFARVTDLAGSSCVPGYNFVGKNAVAADDHGHGTHVAGTIAQATHNAKGVAGLAPCAALMPIKVLSRQGFGSMADVAEGIRFAADHGAQVVNLSLGSPLSSRVVHNAVKYALGKGVVVVAAAGNSGRSVGYPAAHPGVVAVSASDRNDNLAWFSSRGPEVTLAAPGVAVVQQTVCEAGRNKCEQLGTFNGTSMAAPHVAGAAALLVGEGVTRPEAVRAALVASVRPKSDKNLFGAGILDAGAAVASNRWMALASRGLTLLGLLAAVSAWIRRRGGVTHKGLGVLAGGALGATGLLPLLPLVLGPLAAGSLAPLVALASRPLGEWDLLVSARLHGWLVLAGPLPVLAAVALGFGVKRARAPLGGFALGAAALALDTLVRGTKAFALGGALSAVWLGATIALGLWVGRLALDARARDGSS